mmetsp:Transcript_40011/g.39609  ORF Transcript_40011/g.39609 Transcript_40011/m.39609 type:complete len:291 (-) Transcript_40011:777-1649(-)
MLTCFLLSSLKYFLVSILILLLYFSYTTIIQPYFMRRRYKRYPNVALSPNFIPVLGEIKICMDNMSQGRFIFEHYEKAALEKGKDLMLIFSGDLPQFLLFSVKAHDEFLKLFPKKLDRNDYFRDTILKISSGSMDQMRTTSLQKKIKKELMSSLGLNTLSKKIPEIIQILQQHLASWQTKDFEDISDNLSSLTFDIISHSIFGECYTKIPDCRYINESGTVETLKFGKCFRKVLSDTLNHYFTPVAKFFPAVSKYNLVKPYSTDKKNVDEIDRILLKFVKENFNQESSHP